MFESPAEHHQRGVGDGRVSFFTCESTTAGHPDKIADQIADALVDEVLRQDELGRAGIEVLVNSTVVVVSGELHTDAVSNIHDVVLKTIENIGYDDNELGFSSKNLSVLICARRQSPEISAIIDKGGASDQGIVFGYATNETEEFMPAPLIYAAKLAKELDVARKSDRIPYLRPDGKTQVTFEYINGLPTRIDAIVIAAQHDPGVSTDVVRHDLEEDLVPRIIPESLIDSRTKIIINKHGPFVLGGPAIDTGVTGRKLVVDTYGGFGPIGGGALSGKDPSKLDRLGAYYGRYIAKNIVAAGLAERCQLQIAYAFGEMDAISSRIDTFGTSTFSNAELLGFISKVFPMSAYAGIDLLNLRRPIYAQTAAYGHFGWPYPWEELNHVGPLRRAARLS